MQLVAQLKVINRPEPRPRLPPPALPEQDQDPSEL